MTKQKKLRHNEYYNIQDTFDKLYADSLKGAKFNNLMDIIKSPNNIKLAYRNIKTNKGSMTYGTDKITIEDIKSIPIDKYIVIVQKKLSYYKPKPVRRVEIPKPNGKLRPLGIPTMTDRIIQQCILQVLEPICEAKFHERNNGFRPNRSVENALAQCYKMIQQQNLFYVVDIDIKGFFDNVNHSKLIKQMWALGIRDKQLICIIKEMLKAPIIMPNGETVKPICGTPQGGILSPLLSNIVLNELDWWISSQWETMPTHYQYKLKSMKSGTLDRGPINRALKASNLKEMYIVRYADDFKIFCRTQKDAEKIFIAVKQWLWERLKLQISEEKSKIVNLKKHYSEFLGFKIKAQKKGNSYIVKSHIRDKAIGIIIDKLKEQIKKIRKPKDVKQVAYEIHKYNQMVEGIQNYYRIATCISMDCAKIGRVVTTAIKNRLKYRHKKTGIINNEHIKERYGKSKQMLFVNDRPIVPIGYIHNKSPMYKKKKICKYTVEGREEIHKNLTFDNYVLQVINKLATIYKSDVSIEYADNRISLYAAQKGKCAVTGEILNIDDIHCHHKVPKCRGGTDSYHNLIIVHKDIHCLIHAVKDDVINKYLNKFNFTTPQINKINQLRKNVLNNAIVIN